MPPAWKLESESKLKDLTEEDDDDNEAALVADDTNDTPDANE